MNYLKIATACACLIGGSAAAQDVATERTAAAPSATSLTANLHVVSADQLGDPVISVGIGADYDLTESLSVGGTLDYWSESTGSLANQAVTVSDIAIGGNAKMRFDIDNENLKPYGLVGVALHRFAVTFSEKDEANGVIDQYEDTYSDVEGELGADLGAGVLYSLQQGLDASAEIKYRNIIDPNVQLDQLAIGAGIHYRL